MKFVHSTCLKLWFGIFLFSVIVLQCGHAAQSTVEQKPFVIVIPSYNNRDWYQENLDSVFQQNYQNFRMIYVADAPTDGTDRLVEDYIRKYEQQHRVTLLRNKRRSGPLACMVRACYLCNKDEIIVELDGNDWLTNRDVLSRLNEAYLDPEIWMTWGQFIRYPSFEYGFASEVPQDIVDRNEFRSHGGSVTHLRTFYAGLFHAIEKRDFLYENQFFPKAGDLAYSIPMLEMAGAHTKYIPEILYVFNHSYPFHEHKLPGDTEEYMDRYIRNKEKYVPLQEAPYLESQTKGASQSIYSQIHDIYHPTLHDYRFIQDYLTYGKRDCIELLCDMEASVRNIKIVGNTPAEFPCSGIFHVNCGKDEKENCLLVYATFNKNYPNGLKRLLNLIKNSDFKGHVLYRLGGWPNAEEGDLVLSHVPYAFKVCFFREAQRLGYTRALWLDTAVVPLVSLNTIFDAIEEKGYLVMGNSHVIGPYMNPEAAVYFGLTHQQTYEIPSCSAGLFGVDFSNELGRQIIHLWHRAAHDKNAFFSARSDQNALSIILYQLNLSDFINLARMPHSRYEIKQDSLFWLDREFVY